MCELNVLAPKACFSRQHSQRASKRRQAVRNMKTQVVLREYACMKDSSKQEGENRIIIIYNHLNDIAKLHSILDVLYRSPLRELASDV